MPWRSTNASTSRSRSNGTLAQDCEYEWVEPHREATRQQALDTHRALAAELAAAQPEEALAVLDTAIGHSPYADPLYQDAMRIHHQLGDLNGIRARHRDLPCG
jgi:DNA-binding SARP family transcriptional activator